MADVPVLPLHAQQHPRHTGDGGWRADDLDPGGLCVRADERAGQELSVHAAAGDDHDPRRPDPRPEGGDDVQVPNPFGTGSWYNTYLALIVPFLASVFGIFLLRQFFMQIPKDLFDAALIDGSGHLRYLSHDRDAAVQAGAVSVALINFIWAWDSFKWPLLVTRDSNMRVLAVGLQQFLVGEGGTKIQSDDGLLDDGGGAGDRLLLLHPEVFHRGHHDDGHQGVTGDCGIGTRDEVLGIDAPVA